MSSTHTREVPPGRVIRTTALLSKAPLTPALEPQSLPLGGAVAALHWGGDSDGWTGMFKKEVPVEVHLPVCLGRRAGWEPGVQRIQGLWPLCLQSWGCCPVSAPGWPSSPPPPTSSRPPQHLPCSGILRP